jgi:hypothetical protein
MARMTTARKLLLGLLGGSAAALNPLTIPGLALWLDASDSTTLFQASNGTTPATADTDPIGYWGDKSGNGRNATQGTAGKRPILKTAVQNGLNVVRFDGIAHQLAHTLDTNNSAYTVLAVVNSGSGTNYRAMFSSTGAFVASYLLTNTPKWGVYANAEVVSSYSLVGVWSVISVTARNFNDIDLGTNGVIETKATGAGWYGVGPFVGSGELTDQFYDGDMAELLVYTGALSIANRAAVTAYLNGKWAAY